jgi:hypothetical protein
VCVCVGRCLQDGLNAAGTQALYDMTGALLEIRMNMNTGADPELDRQVGSDRPVLLP